MNTGGEQISLFAATAAAVRRNLAGIVAFGIAFYLLRTSLLAPIQAAILGGILSRSGTAYVANFDIAAFLLSGLGLIWLVSTLAIGLTLATLQQSGAIMLALADRAGGRGDIGGILRHLLREAPRILSATLVPTAIGIALAALLAIWFAFVAATFLSDHDINYYLAERPPAFFFALGLGVLGVLALAPFAATLLVIWAVSLPEIVAGRGWGPAALRQGWAAAKGQRLRVLLTVAAWIAGVSALVGVIGAALYAGAAALIGNLDPSGWAFVPVTGAVLVLMDVTLSLAALVGAGSVAFLIEALSHRMTGGVTDADIPLRDPAAQQATRRGLPTISAGLAALALASAAGTYTLTHSATVPLSTPLIVAHRGASIAAPENTMAAFARAVSDGADVIELDVQRSADGQLVALHDKDVARTTDGQGNIWDLTVAQLAAFDAGGGEPIPTFADVLDAYASQIDLFVELKVNGHDPGLARAVVDALLARPDPYRHAIISLDKAALQEVEVLDPTFRTGLLVSGTIGNVLELDVDFLAISKSLATTGFMARAEAAEMPVHVWTVNDPAEMERVADLGASGIITDVPDTLRETLRIRADRSDLERLVAEIGRRLGGPD